MDHLTIIEPRERQEGLTELIKLSATEFGICISHKERREHGPEDFYQTVYTAFSLCLDCTQLQTITSVADVAHVLMEQTEVNDFIAKGIDPVWLWPTVALAWYLLRYADCAVFEADCARTRSSSGDRGSLFLDVWEHFVYPVLKAPEHNEWAEKWRGGHITNYV